MYDYSNTHKPEVIMMLGELEEYTFNIMNEGIRVTLTDNKHIDIATDLENILMMCSNSVLTIIECKKEYPVQTIEGNVYLKPYAVKEIFGFITWYVNMVTNNENFHMKHIIKNGGDSSYDFTTGFPDNTLKLSKSH